MPITIDITPELEIELRKQATLAGMTPDAYIITTLKERLRQSRRRSATPSRPTASLSNAETSLLRKINAGLPEKTWQRYHELIARRQAETLTPEEQAELIGISDQIEEVNTQRIHNLIELARLRQVSLDTLMNELDIKAPTYG